MTRYGLPAPSDAHGLVLKVEKSAALRPLVLEKRDSISQRKASVDTHYTALSIHDNKLHEHKRTKPN